MVQRSNTPSPAFFDEAQASLSRKAIGGAARSAFKDGRNLIETVDLRNTFENYSNERLQDIVNEFRTELPEIEKILYGMRATEMERRTQDSFLYSNDALTKKLRGIIEQGRYGFANGRAVTPKSLAEFLYKIDFIMARRDESDEVIRRYCDQSRHLQSQFADFGFHWEVHPAYRWALQPGDRDIFNLVDLDADNARASP